MRACRSKDAKRRAPQHGRESRELWPLFSYVSLSLGLSCVNWASQECCVFYLRLALRSSNLPLFYFRGLFPSRSFSHRHSGLPFPYSNYLTVLYNLMTYKIFHPFIKQALYLYACYWVQGTGNIKKFRGLPWQSSA